MQPVRTRSRLGAFAAVGAAALVVPVLVLASHERRQDLIALPPGWVLAAAALWAIAFAASLAAALVPARGDVLPAPARGSRAGLGAVLALLVFVLCDSVEAPGVSLRPEDVHRTLAGTAAHCAGFALLMAAPCLLLGLLALRRLAPMGGARLGWPWARRVARWVAWSCTSSARSRTPDTSRWGTWAAWPWPRRWPPLRCRWSARADPSREILRIFYASPWPDAWPKLPGCGLLALRCWLRSPGRWARAAAPRPPRRRRR